MSKENSEGVWRTIRGRRIFIASGQSLGEAMAKSGKFNRSDIRESREFARDEMASKKSEKYSGKKIKYSQLNSLDKEKYNKYDRKYQKEQNKIEKSKPDIYANRDNQDTKNRIHENEPINEFAEQRTTRNYNRYSEADKRELWHEHVQKKLADYKAKKQSNNKIDNKKSWLTSQDSDWLDKQGHKEKLDKLASNYNSKGDIEADERNLNNMASDYFYDKAGIYNENIDSIATKWAHDKAVELNKHKIKEDIKRIGDTDINALRSLAKKVKEKQSNNKTIEDFKAKKQSNNKINDDVKKFTEDYKNARKEYKEKYGNLTEDEKIKKALIEDRALEQWGATDKARKQIEKELKETGIGKQSNNKIDNEYYGSKKAQLDLEMSKYTSKEKLERAKEKLQNNNLDKEEKQYYQDYIEKREGKSIKDILKQSNNKVDPYDDPESEESQRLQDIQSRYDEYLQDTEGRGASYGEIAHIDSLRGKDLDDFEKELDDYEAKKYNKQETIKNYVAKKQSNNSLTSGLSKAEEKELRENYSNSAKFDLGKVDLNGTGRKVNQGYLELELKNGVFSASGGIRNARGTDSVIGGQALDDMAPYYKDNKDFNTIRDLWKKYHLNDMHSGTEKQESAITKKFGKQSPNNYENEVKYLKSIGLYEDNGYRYGSGWLKRDIPTNDLKKIKDLIEKYKK